LDDLSFGVFTVHIRSNQIHTPPKGRKARKKVSCLDLMGDLVGHFEGPPDLSTNKRYLREAILAFPRDDDRLGFPRLPP
jgi:hypothetical protein